MDREPRMPRVAEVAVAAGIVGVSLLWLWAVRLLAVSHPLTTGEMALFLALPAVLLVNALGGLHDDLHAGAMGLAWLALFGGGFAWFAGDLEPGPSSAANRAALAGVLVAAACLAYSAWTRLVRGPHPDPLQDRFPRRKILEAAGVQFAFELEAESVRDGGAAFLRVFLQNATARARVVMVRPVVETRVLPGGPGIAIAEEAQAVLRPAAAGVIHFPVRVDPGAGGRFVIRPTADVEGRKGPRVRPWRAWAFADAAGPAILLGRLVMVVSILPRVVRLDLRVEPGPRGNGPPEGAPSIDPWFEELYDPTAGPTRPDLSDPP